MPSDQGERKFEREALDAPEKREVTGSTPVPTTREKTIVRG
jgi:hypothetical protein